MTNQKIVIEKHEFELWLDQPTTKALLSSLQNIRAEISHALQDCNVIMDDKASKLLPRLLGQREGIDLVLEMKFEDFEVDKEQ